MCCSITSIFVVVRWDGEKGIPNGMHTRVHTRELLRAYRALSVVCYRLFISARLKSALEQFTSLSSRFVSSISLLCGKSFLRELSYLL